MGPGCSDTDAAGTGGEGVGVNVKEKGPEGVYGVALALRDGMDPHDGGDALLGRSIGVDFVNPLTCGGEGAEVVGGKLSLLDDDAGVIDEGLTGEGVGWVLRFPKMFDEPNGELVGGELAGWIGTNDEALVENVLGGAVGAGAATGPGALKVDLPPNRGVVPGPKVFPNTEGVANTFGVADKLAKAEVGRDGGLLGALLEGAKTVVDVEVGPKAEDGH